MARIHIVNPSSTPRFANLMRESDFALAPAGAWEWKVDDEAVTR